MKIEDIEVSLLRPYPENCKIHPKKNLRLIRNSIKEFGQYKPLLVQKGTNYILVGNGTFKVLKQLGYEKAKVCFIEVDDKKAKVINIADNKLSQLSKWNNELLVKLEKWNLDFIQSLEFDNKFLKQFEKSDINLDKFKEPKNELEIKEEEVNCIHCPSCNRQFVV